MLIKGDNTVIELDENPSSNNTYAFNSGNYNELFVALYCTKGTAAIGSVLYDNILIRLADDRSTVYGGFSKPNTELTKDDSGLTANAFENGCVNLFEVTLSSGVQNEVAYVVNADKTVSVSVTQQATSQLIIGLGQFTFKAGKRYRLSGCPSGAGSTTYGLYTGGAFDKEDRGNGIELVSNVDVTTNISILIRKNCPVVNNVVFKPMITVADMPNSDYAHYVPYAKSNRELTEELSVIGNYVVSQPGSSVSVPNDTGTEVASITLNKGIWLLIGCVNASSGTGAYSTQFDSSAKNAARDKTVTNQLMSDRQSFTQVSVVKNIQSDSTEVKLYSYYTGAGSLTVYPYIMAVKIK